MRAALWAVVAGSLFAATVSDLRTREVYNFIWWIGGAAGVALLVISGNPGREGFLELVLFCIVQLCLFTRMYGRADCYAFCVCAVAAASEGLGFLSFLMHMTITFTILACVQLFRCNIDRRGNLREPVPLIPYISISYVLLFLIFCCL